MFELRRRPRRRPRWRPPPRWRRRHRRASCASRAGFDDFGIAAAVALRDGGHWGQGYAEPLFDGTFEVLAWRVVGERCDFLPAAASPGATP